MVMLATGFAAFAARSAWARHRAKSVATEETTPRD